MANLKIETSIDFVTDVDTDDYPVDYTIEDILESVRGHTKVLVTDAIENDIAHVTTKTLETVDGT